VPRRHELLSYVLAVVGTGIAFAFLEAGAFHDFGRGTWERMTAAPGLRAAALGAGLTAALVSAGLLLERWAARRGDRGGPG
jgi:hypothetical protein